MNLDSPPRWRELLGRHVLWPLPALVVQGLILIGSRRIWQDVSAGMSRSGGGYHIQVAHQVLLIAAFCAGIYWATYWLGEWLFIGHRMFMREPSEAEKGCALVILRGLLLLVLYLLTYALLRAYVFDPAPQPG